MQIICFSSDEIFKEEEEDYLKHEQLTMKDLVLIYETPSLPPT